MRRASLRARIEKLERKTQARRWPQVCAGIYDCRDEDLIGVQGWQDGISIQIPRQPGETLQALAARAFDSGTVLNFAAQYAPRLAVEPPQRDLPIVAVQAPKKPEDLAGIGKIATLEQLQRMGALPVAPERLID